MTIDLGFTRDGREAPITPPIDNLAEEPMDRCTRAGRERRHRPKTDGRLSGPSRPHLPSLRWVKFDDHRPPGARAPHPQPTLGFAFALCLFLPALATGGELFDGRTLTGWELVATPQAKIEEVCRYNPDGSLTVLGRPSGYLATAATYTNYRLHVEWRWPAAPGNSGILLHIGSGPIDRVWPLCLQVQTKHGSTGDLLPMAGASFAEPLSTPAGAKTPQLNHAAPDSEKPPGEWNTCEITCRDGAVQIRVNGVLQNRVTGCRPGAGKIGFQLEGAPFELRHVRLEPF